MAMSADDLTALMDRQQRELKQILQQYQQAGPPTDEEVEINSAAIRLPTFWVAKPELWFAQIEANFALRRPQITTQESKYYYILQALPQDVLTECEHVIEAPSDHKYDAMKKALLKAYSRSAAKKMRSC